MDTFTAQIEVTDGTFSAHVARPTGSARASVLVLHEIFGVNADMRATCVWLAQHGFVAVAPDLFWRQQPGVDLTDADPAAWDRGFALYKAFDREKAIEDIGRTATVARGLAGPGRKVGVMGFCLGGLMTFRSALHEIGEAAVSFYGAETEKYLDESRSDRVPLLVHLARNDEYMPRAAQDAIADALNRRHGSEVYSYEGCHHAFARRAGQHYVAQAADLANERTLRFLMQHLAP
jgi:carboxymethylenebutenolidase